VFNLFQRSKLSGAGEKGVSLIETLIAIALLGIIGTSLMSGMMGIYRATPIASEQDIGKSLAQSQMEYVMERPYALSYTPSLVPSIYPSYTVQISTDPFRDGNIEKITVTVRHEDKEVSILEAYKTNH
jgi:prepilin-type N-terminal cleavage/methylation domain-containing protein